MGGSDRNGRRPLPQGEPVASGPPRSTPVTAYRFPSGADPFGDEEPPSFGSRLTPVVPVVAWPPEPKAEAMPGSTGEGVVPATSEAVAPAEDPAAGPEMAAFPLARASMSELPSYASEELPLSEPELDSPPPVRRSLLRSTFAKLLFLLVFSAAMALLAYEISVVFRIPWLDVRWVIARIRRP